MSFGNSTAIDGNTLIVSVYNKDIIYVYEKNNTGFWELKQEIKPNDVSGDKNFGYNLSISGNTIMAGASRDNDDLGAVYFFERNTDGVWEQSTKITSPVPSSSYSDAYWGGAEININGDVATAGRNNGLNTSFQVMERQANDTWEITGTLDAGTSNFVGGKTTYISDNEIIIPGTPLNMAKLYSFSRTTKNSQWGEAVTIPIIPAKSINYFGSYLMVSGNTMVIGSPQEDITVDGNTITAAGKVYIFEKKNGIWSETLQLHANDPHSNDYFGDIVAIENNTIIISAANNDTDQNDENNVSNAGAVYVFKYENNNWVQTQKITEFIRTESDQFGKYISLNNGNLVVGTYQEVHVYTEDKDCMGIEYGKAFYDVCNQCAEGTSHNEATIHTGSCETITEITEFENSITQISPNPFNENGFSISHTNTNLESIIIRDLNGNIQFETSTINGQEQFGQQLSKGMYLITLISSEGNITTQKIIKD